MNGAESFLARWSRRKREGTALARLREDPPPSATEDPRPVPSTEPEAPAALPLPPIDAIESASDIKAFLAPGVPLELTRAALRRAWTADPAIRDFIGLSENAWDFNAPDGVPGFGSLAPDQVRRLVEEVLGEPKATDPTTAPATLPNPSDPPAGEADAPPALPTAESPGNIAAAQYKKEERKPRESSSPRRHGGALPQ
jgi:hypothetical protein